MKVILDLMIDILNSVNGEPQPYGRYLGAKTVIHLQLNRVVRDPSYNVPYMVLHVNVFEYWQRPRGFNIGYYHHDNWWITALNEKELDIISKDPVVATDLQYVLERYRGQFD